LNLRPSHSSAAVLLILLREEEDYVLLTKRSATLRTHAGEVALPGGKHEEGDSSLYRTAQRETREEVGIGEHQFIYQGELSGQRTRHGTGAIPYIVELRERPKLNLSEAEIESAKWVPLKLFIRDRRSRTDIFEHSGIENWAPVYHYEDYEIWGFTARVMASFINRFYGGRIRRRHPVAPERLFVPKRL